MQHVQKAILFCSRFLKSTSYYNVVLQNSTHNERPKEESQPFVEFEQVQQQQKWRDQKLQHRGCNVLCSRCCSETHKRHKQSHLKQREKKKLSFTHCLPFYTMLHIPYHIQKEELVLSYLTSTSHFLYKQLIQKLLYSLQKILLMLLSLN